MAIGGRRSCCPSDACEGVKDPAASCDAVGVACGAGGGGGAAVAEPVVVEAAELAAFVAPVGCGVAAVVLEEASDGWREVVVGVGHAAPPRSSTP